MKKKVLILNGAIKVKGNTDALLEKVIEGSAETKINVDSVTLREKKVGNCIGCYQCFEKATCSIQDDMTQIRDCIQATQLLVFASPLYWCGVTGLMKTFIDRLFFYYHPQTKSRISGKRALIITPMNQQNVVYESETLVQFYSRLLNCLGIGPIDMFFFGGIMKKSDLALKPQFLEEAFNIGKDLGELTERDGRKPQRTRVHIFQ